MKTMTDRSSNLLRLATAFGMDPEARAALAQLEALAGKGRRIAVAGCFMPDAEIGLRLAGQGICQNVNEADFGHYTQVVIPFSGISPSKRKQWQNAGVPLTDLTSPQVRRAHVALGLLRMDGAQPLVIGRHGDPESKALAAGNPGTRILEDTTDTAQLVFSPAFGAVCQTTLSPRRVSWLVQQLRLRYNDARVTFLDTASPSMTARDQALEKLMADRDRVIIVGQPGEATCEALAETALRKGKPSTIVGTAAELDFFEISRDRVALTAGGFTLDSTIREVAEALQRR
jgi:4-hydroxy-3-methylbut-2-enyl diphosphate reductase IspH